MSCILRRSIRQIFIKHISYYPFLTIKYRPFSSSCKDPKNPFHKKIIRHSIQGESKEVTRMCVTILGNGAYGQPQCVGLFTDNKGILFNCGEGVGRLLREYGGSFYLIKYAFVTRKDWECLSGLIDIHLTHESYGIHSLYLFGPPGIEYFTNIIASDVTRTKVVKRDTPYFDSAFEIKSICVQSADSKTVRKHNQGTRDIFSYSCRIFEKPDVLDPERLIEHNVPFVHLPALKRGEDVTLPCGKIVHSSDVLDPHQKEEIFLVVDCPSENYLLSFVRNKEFCEYQLSANSASKVSSVFHFSPPHIVQSKLYQDWMKKFNSATQHYILNTSCSVISSEAVHQTQSIFHLIHPNIFKLLPEQTTESKDFDSSNIHRAPPMLQINYRPKKSINWSNVMNYKPEKYISETKYLPTFTQEIENLRSLMESKSAFKSIEEYPEVLFLGTGSSTSSPYRNVTGIIININSTRSILLDCGEGTSLQMVRYFGSKNVDSELRKISCIFISHLHTDHYLGLFQLIKFRKDAFNKIGIPYQKPAVILPYKVLEFLKAFSYLFEPLFSKVRIFVCKTFTAQNRTVDRLKKLQVFIGDIEIETVPVKHCVDSYGIVLNSSDWKIVFSGDSAPCQSLIDAGENCTLLIHEASIEDGCINEASMRKHCTPSQVIDISEKMNAQHTIMTHFSKRYLAIPVLENSSNRPMGYAFDFMKVQLNQLPLVPYFLPAMQCLFQEQLDSHSERTSFVVNFENNFLKSYRSVIRS